MDGWMDGWVEGRTDTAKLTHAFFAAFQCKCVKNKSVNYITAEVT